MEVQKHLGEIKASLDSLTKTVDSTKTKVDALIAWRNMIFGGVVTLSVVCTAIGFGISKFSGYFTIKQPDQPAAAAPAPTQNQAPPNSLAAQPEASRNSQNAAAAK